VLRFGPDGKLYGVIGDNGRRGQLQNLSDGPPPQQNPPSPPFQDDQFGGPAPDNNHFTGIIMRLNEDASTPADNPFFSASAPFSRHSSRACRARLGRLAGREDRG
jgi:glucose/arabinose dehydrogenase